jgi:hypothetical protein
MGQSYLERCIANEGYADAGSRSDCRRHAEEKLFQRNDPSLPVDPDAVLPNQCPTATDPTLSVLLNRLIEVDIEYERERENPLKDRHPSGRAYRLEALKKQHRVRREPYLQRLALLQGGTGHVAGCKQRRD